MIERKFMTPSDVKPEYNQITVAYQNAYKVPPWKEASKCVDSQNQCIGGFSSLEVGELCKQCGNCTERPAHETTELIRRFENVAATRSAMWYIEKNVDEVVLAAFAWVANASTIAQDKYYDVSKMNNWLEDKLGSQQIMWLDEVFANKSIRSEDNLQKFGNFVLGLVEKLGCSTVAYRTIEPRMTTATNNNFGTKATFYSGDYQGELNSRITYKEKVPDRRDFVIINLDKEL